MMFFQDYYNLFFLDSENVSIKNLKKINFFGMFKKCFVNRHGKMYEFKIISFNIYLCYILYPSQKKFNHY